MESVTETRKRYTKPTNPFIGKNDNTEILYRREEKRDEAFKAAARELGKVLGHEEKEFWTKTLPEAYFSLLDHWDRQAGEVACIAFLEKQGYVVSPK